MNSALINNTVNITLQNYIIDSITNDDAIEEGTAQDKLNYVFEEFNKQANYPANCLRFKTRDSRIADWMQGLPSCLNVEYENFKILEKLTKLGLVVSTLTEDQEYEILSNWFLTLAVNLAALFDQISG